jgi:cysteine desulfurase
MDVSYFDHHSTTPCHPAVVEAMLPYFSEVFGNPAAVTHPHGRRAATAVQGARETVADFLGVRPAEIYFTAGATESNNLVLRGAGLNGGDHLISSRLEHKSVLRPLDWLQSQGIEITYVAPDREGFISPESVERAMRPETRLVSVMAANGEIGTLQPVGELARLCRSRNVLFHSDATQAIGKVPFDLSEIDADFVSFSGHKLYGPKGIGGLFIRRGRKIDSWMTGGGQERAVRAGTVNVPGVVGLAAAMELRRGVLESEGVRLERFRNQLWDRLTGEIEGVTIHGPRSGRLPGNLNFGLRGIESEALMLAMRRYSLSSGSACSSGEAEPSAVLLAIGVEPARALESIRVGLGRENTEAECEAFVDELHRIVPKLREMAL